MVSPRFLTGSGRDDMSDIKIRATNGKRQALLELPEQLATTGPSCLPHERRDAAANGAGVRLDHPAPATAAAQTRPRGRRAAETVAAGAATRTVDEIVRAR